MSDGFFSDHSDGTTASIGTEFGGQMLSLPEPITNVSSPDGQAVFRRARIDKTFSFVARMSSKIATASLISFSVSVVIFV
jgi:hypothetical protein